MINELSNEFGPILASRVHEGHGLPRPTHLALQVIGPTEHIDAGPLANWLGPLDPEAYFLRSSSRKLHVQDPQDYSAF